MTEVAFFCGLGGLCVGFLFGLWVTDWQILRKSK